MLNAFLMQDENLPDLGNLDKRKVITTITDLYWKEWVEVMEKAETNAVFIRGLGSFEIKLRSLKLRIGDLIRKMRKHKQAGGWGSKEYSDLTEKFIPMWKQYKDVVELYNKRLAKMHKIRELKAKGEWEYKQYTKV